MKSLIKLLFTTGVMIAFLFAGVTIGNGVQTNAYPYGTVCEGGTCVDNWNYTCCLEYATGGCTPCSTSNPNPEYND